MREPLRSTVWLAVALAVLVADTTLDWGLGRGAWALLLASLAPVLLSIGASIQMRMSDAELQSGSKVATLAATMPAVGGIVEFTGLAGSWPAGGSLTALGVLIVSVLSPMVLRAGGAAEDAVRRRHDAWIWVAVAAASSRILFDYGSLIRAVVGVIATGVLLLAVAEANRRRGVAVGS